MPGEDIPERPARPTAEQQSELIKQRLQEILAEPNIMTAAALENLLQRARIRNFKATFDVEVDLDGMTVPVEVTVPEGQLEHRTAYEHESLDDPWNSVLLSPGRLVMHLKLYPVRSLDRDKAATIRVVR